MLPMSSAGYDSWLIVLGNRVYSKTLADIWDNDDEDIEACLFKNVIEIVYKEDIVGKKYVVSMLISRLSIQGLELFCFDITNYTTKDPTYRPSVCESPTFKEDFERDITLFHRSVIL